MKRVIVLGGRGLFGRTITERLQTLGIAAVSASRSAGAPFRIDAEDRDSIRAACHRGDLVIDVAGPFQERSTTLIESAAEIGFDVIDLNDDLSYAEQVLSISQRINDASIRVLSSASSVSAISAAVIKHSAIQVPIRVSAFLAPASRHTANPGAARSLIRSVGKPVRVLRGGKLQTLRGWSEARRFAMPKPIGPICGRLFESADAVYLPRIWPSLRDVAMFVDSNATGVNSLLRLAAVFPMVRRVLESQLRFGTWIARRFGSIAGGIGYEIASMDGTISRYAVVSKRDGYLTAVAPAVLAAAAIVSDRFVGHGLVLPDRHVAPAELFEFLSRAGIDIVEVRE